jgi:hypothetical protein
MMAGGTQGDNTIKVNIVSFLRPKLRGGHCRVFDTDMKCARPAATPIIPTPLSIAAGGTPRRPRRLNRPWCFEVLLKSTRDTDLDTKLPAYKATPAIRQIVYVEADRIHLMIWRRTDEGWEEDEVVHPNARLELTPLGLELPLIYEDVAFEG